MTTKSAFPALYAPISPAWERGCLHIDRCELPKRVEGGSLSLNMAFIRGMSVETQPGDAHPTVEYFIY